MAVKKVTLTISEDLLEEIREDVAERGISASVTEALRAQRGRDKLLGLVSWLDEEYGPSTEEELATASAELDGLDAEFDRRRADSRLGRVARRQQRDQG
ncbi:CopG family transcriptional regulator [Streptomyces sp. NPDC058405]|uniref:CopG family transcriptional regulator n=1 Tax=Streptomyces sp. NPDC058405 TaxID=3346482 RepID=UPI003664052C